MVLKGAVSFCEAIGCATKHRNRRLKLNRAFGNVLIVEKQQRCAENLETTLLTTAIQIHADKRNSFTA